MARDMAAVARCDRCNQVTPDHCPSPVCPWVKCPTHGEIRLTDDQYMRLRGRA